MATAVASFVGQKVLTFAIEKAMGAEVAGASIGTWTERVVMTMFTGRGLAPEANFEQLVGDRFKALEDTVAALDSSVKDLQREFNAFQFRIEETLLKNTELQHLGQFDALATEARKVFQTMSEDLGKSKATLEVRAQRTRQIADDILRSGAGMESAVENSRTLVIGKDQVAGEKLTGLMQIWQQQAAREADDAGLNSLVKVYQVFEAKFLYVLLIQASLGRLVLEAKASRNAEDATLPSGVDYYVDEFFPILLEEVAAFRSMVESIALNMLPLPDEQAGHITMPTPVASMLTLCDMFIARVLSGKVTNEAAPVRPTNRTLPGLPALSGVWGRIFVPGTRWIARKSGTDEQAHVRVFKLVVFEEAGLVPGDEFICSGHMVVRDVPFIEYADKNGVQRHAGYRMQIGNDFRDYKTMLLVEFLPFDVIPPNLRGVARGKLEDINNTVLAEFEIAVVEVTLADTDAPGKKAPFAAFTEAFTGGADIRTNDRR